MSGPVLQMRNIVKWYGAHEVLSGVNLQMSDGEVVVLLGASGSGKSTLLKTANLIEQIDDGQILLAGADISDPRVDQDKVRSRIGVVFQQFNLFPHLTV
ncbi:MAG: ATP-binding cassette domain-containing protein, partial [Propionibacteriaceae bacterium]|nr:ATP-binding cassette domain-containing protein [Propionibacteriaceae bacterium]